MTSARRIIYTKYSQPLARLALLKMVICGMSCKWLSHVKVSLPVSFSRAVLKRKLILSRVVKAVAFRIGRQISYVQQWLNRSAKTSLNNFGFFFATFWPTVGSFGSPFASSLKSEIISRLSRARGGKF